MTLNSMLADPNESCRFWAAWSAALLGTQEGYRVLTEIAQVAGPWCEPALDLLLRRLPIERANEVLRPLGRDPLRRRTSFGNRNDRRSALFTLVNRPDLRPHRARCAGDAFVTITGADVDDLRQDPPPNFNDGPNDDPNDERVTPGEDEGLAWLDPMKCRRWWEANSSRFHVGKPYFQGRPKPSIDWVEVLAEARQGLRRSAAIELALQRPGQAMFEVRARGDLQRWLLKRTSG